MFQITILKHYQPKEKMLRIVTWHIFLEIEAKVRNFLRLSCLYVLTDRNEYSRPAEFKAKKKSAKLVIPVQKHSSRVPVKRVCWVGIGEKLG